MMKNLNLLKNVFALTMIFLTLGLTACSEGGGGKSKASTNACPSNAYYNTLDGEWYISHTDLRVCNPLPGVQPHGCGPGEVVVRSPYQYDADYDPRLLNQSNYGNTNYHSQHGSYQEICMTQGGSGWSHVSNAGFYYYVDIGLINASVYGNVGYSTPPIVYQPQNNNNTALILGLGVLAALFILN